LCVVVREFFPGWHRLPDDHVDLVWTTGIVGLDTNVLLGLYRMSDPVREHLLEILTKLKGRLFVPHHVAAEFQRSRIS
jgi:hypothetical protein